MTFKSASFKGYKIEMRRSRKMRSSQCRSGTICEENFKLLQMYSNTPILYQSKNLKNKKLDF